MKDKYLTIRCDPAHREAWKKAAEADHRTLSGWVEKRLDEATEAIAFRLCLRHAHAFDGKATATKADLLRAAIRSRPSGCFVCAEER